MIRIIHSFVSRRLMFWTDIGKNPRIERATLAGHDRRVLVSTNIANLVGLTVDYTAKKIYFSDSSLRRIESMNYDGKMRSVLYSDPNMAAVGGLAVYQSTLFWINGKKNHNTIEKLDLKTKKHIGNFGDLGILTTNGLVVWQPQSKST